MRNNLIFKKITIGLSAIFIFNLAFALNQTLRKYSVQEGLAHKTISDIYRDSNGFLWIGTTNGLSRFDGYTFKNFSFSKNDSLALNAYMVSCITEDTLGNIWLATNNGIKYYNPLTETFHSIQLPKEVKSNFMAGVTIDNKGNIWANNNLNDIIKISNTGGKWHAEIPWYLKSNSYSNFADIVYSNNCIWIICHECILKIDDKEETIKCIEPIFPYKFNSQFKLGNADELISVFIHDGIFIYNTSTETKKWIKSEDIFPNRTEDISLYTANRLKNNNLLLVTSLGLFSYNEIDKTVAPFSNQIISNEILKDFTTEAYIDKEDILWIGTLNLGIFAIKPQWDTFQSSENKCATQLPFIKTFRIYDDKSILFADNEGLHISKNVNDVNEGIRKTITSKTVSHINTINNDTSILVISGELFFHSRKTNTIHLLKKTTSIHTTYFDSTTNVIWYGAWGSGLNGINIKTKKSYSISLNSSSAHNNSIFAISGNSQGTLFLGMYSSGFIVVEKPLQNDRILKFHSQHPSKDSLSYNSILSVYSDDKGSVWIGTCGGGIIQFDIKNNSFKHFDTSNGMNCVVEAIIEDYTGNVWFSSDVLTKLDVKTNSLISYGKSDGIEGGFFYGASAKHKDGEIFFSGINGLISFMPDSIKRKNTPKTPLITNFKLFGMIFSPNDSVRNSQPYKKSLTFSDSLTLPYFCNSFTFEFSSLQFLESDNISYAYMMEGVDHKWIPSTKNQRLASYAGLQPGDYTFQVKASSNKNEWSPAKTIYITITPPWWSELWFKTLIVLLITTTITTLIARRLRNIKNRNTELTELVNQKTTEIKEANTELNLTNSKLKQQAQKLQDHNNNLRENQLVIEMKNEELVESLNIKDKLISVIGHDFKNPLHALQNYVAILKQNRPEETEDDKSIINNIYSLSKNLTDQMLLVLEWAKGQSGDVEFKPVEINIESLLLDAIQLVKHNANSKKINIETQLNYTHNAYVDARMVNTIFRNILSNAIKFTPESGSILVLVHEDETQIEVSIIDTGIGMDEEKTNNIFENFNPAHISYGTNNEKGSGLGLQICKTFVEKNNGTIKVTSSEGKGTTFTILLPKGETIASQKIISIPDLSLSDDTYFDEKNEKEYSILIVEDNEELANSLEKIFKKDYQVFKAFDGLAGMQLAQNMIPDIIVSDLNIPKLSGIELCRKIKTNSHTSHIPVFIITAEKIENIEKISYESGANDFIEKPFEPQILKDKITAVLKSRSKYKELLEKENQGIQMFDLPTSVDDELIEKILNMIKTECSDPDFGVDVIASNVGMSRTQLWRKLKSTINKTPGDIIRDMRLAKAIEMLKTGKYRVSEIAYSVGFTDPKYFSKTFSKKFGVSPSEYKE